MIPMMKKPADSSSNPQPQNMMPRTTVVNVATTSDRIRTSERPMPASSSSETARPGTRVMAAYRVVSPIHRARAMTRKTIRKRDPESRGSSASFWAI
jgi:hypothetical protein